MRMPTSRILVAGATGIAGCLLIGAVCWWLWPNGVPEERRLTAPALTTQATTNTTTAATTSPATHPSAHHWLSPGVYADAKGRLYTRRDSDGDGLYDADEMLMYGTLQFDSTTCRQAMRIDLPPPVTVTGDTDGDGLPDEWEMFFFGNLQSGPWDDNDQDGFPNIIELERRQSPVDPDLVDPSLKPSVLVHAAPGTFTLNSYEFWRKQEEVARRGTTRPKSAAAAEMIRKSAPIRRTSSQPSVPPPDPLRELAKRALRPDEDVDGDGLPDVWEMKYFGTLKYGPEDDPDEDGFPNLIEWYRGTDPTKPNLLPLAFKPRSFSVPSAGSDVWQPQWSIYQERFWQAQDRLRSKLR